MRQLNDEERTATENGIKLLSERNVELEYEIEHTNLIINEGIDFDIEKLKDEAKANLSDDSISEYEFKFYTLQTEKGYDIVAKRMKKQKQSELKQFEGELEMNLETIKLLNRQLEEGVEIKEKKEDKE